MRTNEDRAAEVDQLMDKFHWLTGVDPDPEADGPETALGDMLAHLMHWARREGVDFDKALATGRSHFGNEVCSVCGGTAEDMGVCHDCY